MKKPIAQIRNLIELAIARASETAECFKGDPNPQTVALYHEKCGELSALRAVLDELKGRSCGQLHIMAKGLD